MTYEFDEIDKFPVRIIYKTYELNQDDYGHYISFFKDIYKYEGKDLSKDTWNDASLMTFSTKENILNEYNKKYGWNFTKEKLEEIIDYLLQHGEQYHRYYFEDLREQFLTNK
jgi:hypothetical protein